MACRRRDKAKEVKRTDKYADGRLAGDLVLALAGTGSILRRIPDFFNLSHSITLVLYPRFAAACNKTASHTLLSTLGRGVYWKC